MGYIDIHSHILSGIDDGPDTIEISKKMLQNAFNEGFTTVIATPHCSKGFRTYSKEDVINQCNILDAYAKENISPEFSVLPGQEIFYNESSMKLLSDQEVIPLANSNHILVEFEPNVTFSHMLRGIRELTMSSYFIVLAHIERYACLYNLDRLREIRQLGILTQMNYSEIAGKWYQKNTAFCRKALRNGMVDFLGTDMHDVNLRSSNSQKAFRWLHKNLDADYINCITTSNAKRILHKN